MVYSYMRRDLNYSLLYIYIYIYVRQGLYIRFEPLSDIPTYINASYLHTDLPTHLTAYPCAYLPTYVCIKEYKY